MPKKPPKKSTHPQVVADFMKKNRIISYEQNGFKMVMDPKAFDAPTVPVQNEDLQPEDLEKDAQVQKDLEDDILFHSGG